MRYEDHKKAAITAHSKGDLLTAARHYQVCIEANFQDPVVVGNLGAIYFELGEMNNAKTLFLHRRQLDKKNPVAHFNLARLYQEQKEYVQAEKAYRKAIQLAPKSTEAIENLAELYTELGRSKDKLKLLTRLRGLRADPRDLLAIARAQFELGDAASLTRTINNFRIEFGTTPDLEYLESFSHLREGRFDKAGPGYRHRWQSLAYRESQTISELPPVPQWNGEDLAGKAILILPDQGIGDEILFSSCIQELKKRAARVYLFCSTKLLPLFTRSFAGEEFFLLGYEREKGDEFSSQMRAISGLVDCFAFICDLPIRFYASKSEIVSQNWLIPKKTTLPLGEESQRLKVGLSWRGGGSEIQRSKRSIALEKLLNCFNAEEHKCYALQYDANKEEVARAVQRSTVPLTFFEELDYLNDIDEVLALMDELDLIVTVDNTIAQMAMAISAPSVVLLPPIADWRWFEDDSVARWNRHTKLLRCPPEQSMKALLKALPLKLLETKKRTRNNGHTNHLSSEGPVSQTAMLGEIKGLDFLLINDTLGSHHFGCTLTSIGIDIGLRQTANKIETITAHEIDNLRLGFSSYDEIYSPASLTSLEQFEPGIWKRLERAGTLVLNCENFLRENPGDSIKPLFLAYVAKVRFGKKVHIINLSLQQSGMERLNSEDKQVLSNILTEFDSIAVRDERSKILAGDLGLTVEQSFDCLLLALNHYYAHLPEIKPAGYVVLVGSEDNSQNDALLRDLSSLNGCRNIEIKVLVGSREQIPDYDMRFCHQAKTALGERVEVLFAENESHWIEILASAAAVISGRWHHAITSRFFSRPTIVFGSELEATSEIRTGINAQLWTDTNEGYSALASLLDAAEQEGEDETVSCDADFERLTHLSRNNFRWLPHKLN